MTSSAPAWSSCLKMTRFATCSPVAILTGATAARIRGQAEDLVRARRLLDPVRVPWRQRPDRRDRLRYAPPLVRVDRDPDSRADRVPGQRQPPGVQRQVGADLQLDLAEAVGDRLPATAGRASRRSSRSSPAWWCRRGSRAARARRSGPRGPPWPRAGSPAPRPGSARRRCSGSRPGRRSARASCRPAAATPACRPVLAARSQAALTTAPIAMCMTPFSGPSQRSWLSVMSAALKPPRSAAMSSATPADHMRPQRRDRGHHDLVAAPDGEAQRVPVQAAAVGPQHRVGGRVVRVRVHRVRPVVLDRGRETHVEAVERDDPSGHCGGRRRIVAPGRSRIPRAGPASLALPEGRPNIRSIDRMFTPARLGRARGDQGHILTTATT